MNTTALAIGVWLALGAELYAREFAYDDPESLWPQLDPRVRYTIALVVVPFVPLLYGLFYAAHWIDELVLRCGRKRDQPPSPGDHS